MATQKVPGSPLTRRYSVEEKAQAVRLVRQLRAESVIGRYKAELTRGLHQGPWDSATDAELATLGWLRWHNSQQLHTHLGDVPPTEFEAAYAARRPDHQMVGNQQTHPPGIPGRFRVLLSCFGLSGSCAQPRRTLLGVLRLLASLPVLTVCPPIRPSRTSIIRFFAFLDRDRRGASFSLHLALMSAAQLVREQVEAAPMRSFISTGEVEGSRHAVECELSRLASSGEVIRVRRGLYWKGQRTRLGVSLPRPDEIALAVAGPGAGPARLSAAAHLGLTTQVPAVDTIAAAGRAPTAPAATRFVSRSVERRIRDLTPTEVAVIEVLREGPDLLEVPWEAFAAAVTRLAASRELRHERITEQLRDERHVAARDRWRPLAETLEP